MNTVPSANFYEILLAKMPSKIRLADGTFFVLKKLSFRQYVLFNHVSRKYEKAELLGKLEALLLLFDISVGGIDQFLLTQDALIILNAVNRSNQTLSFSFQQPSDDEKSKPPEDTGLEYEGRDIASVVSLLSETFGWSTDQILDGMSVDEVSAYTQEAIIRRYEQEAFFYNLSEVGFSKGGDGEYKKVPYPKPRWMQKAVFDKITKKTGELSKEQQEIMDRFLPNGVIIDLADTWKQQSQE